jgi:hypothetical protein
MKYLGDEPGRSWDECEEFVLPSMISTETIAKSQGLRSEHLLLHPSPALSLAMAKTDVGSFTLPLAECSQAQP